MVRFWRVGLALCSTSHPRLRWPLVRMKHRGGNVLKDQAFYESLRASPLNPVESGFRYVCLNAPQVCPGTLPIPVAHHVPIQFGGTVRTQSRVIPLGGDLVTPDTGAHVRRL